MKKPTRNEVLKELLSALFNLTIRFEAEYGTTDTECRCLEFEDDGATCRHLRARAAIVKAENL